jgi:hypothetical protein
VSDRLTPQREAEIVERASIATEGPWLVVKGHEIHQGSEFGDFAVFVAQTDPACGCVQSAADAEFVAQAREDVPALLAELAAVRAERDQAQDTVDFLERNTLPDLHRQIQHHKDGKARWRERAEIRDSYTALISQAEQDGDYAGAYDAWRLLQDREEKWKREDATTKPNPTAEEAS